MTRYTNLGYKRTHIEATKLDGGADSAAPAGAAEAPVTNAAPAADGAAGEEKPKKKTHRAGKKLSAKKRKRDGVEDGEGAGADGAGEKAGTDAGGDRPAKKRKTMAAGGADAGEAGASAGDEPANPDTEGKTTAAAKKSKKPKKLSKDFKAKALASEQRRLARISTREAHTICFACREPGHSIRDCPTARAAKSNPSSNKVTLLSETLCYRCGSTGHTLGRCRKPELPGGALPFAKCFVCAGEGHLAGACAENRRGVYPNGGRCKVCGEVAHLAKDCPLRRKDTQEDALVLGMAAGGGDEDDFHVLKRRKAEMEKEESGERKLAGRNAASNPIAKRKVVAF